MLGGMVETIISWVVIVCIVLWLIWAGAIKPVMYPNASHTQNGGAFYDIHPVMGCMKFPYKKIEGLIPNK